MHIFLCTLSAHESGCQFYVLTGKGLTKCRVSSLRFNLFVQPSTSLIFLAIAREHAVLCAKDGSRVDSSISASQTKEPTTGLFHLSLVNPRATGPHGTLEGQRVNQGRSI